MKGTWELSSPPWQFLVDLRLFPDNCILSCSYYIPVFKREDGLERWERCSLCCRESQKREFSCVDVGGTEPFLE